MENYLQPTDIFDFNKPKVKDKAFEITKGLKSDTEKAIALFYWVRDKIRYDMRSYIPKQKINFKASTTLRRGYGFCISKSILLSSLARAVGIPARLHFADIINYKTSKKTVDMMKTDIFYYHGYSELYLNNRWTKLTAVFDKETAIDGGFLPFVEFDGQNDAVFPHHDNDGNPLIEYVEDRGIHIDLPLKDIESLFNEKYGSILPKKASKQELHKKIIN